MGISKPCCYLPLALLFSITFFTNPASSIRLLAETNSTNLIVSTCNLTLYFDVCVSSLLSHPRSQDADLQGLAAISVDVIVAQAKDNIAYAAKLKEQIGDKYVKICLDDCLTQYDTAMDDLGESTVAIQQQDYETMNIMVAGAMDNSFSCEKGFGEKEGIQSPLTDKNEYFMKLCSNSMAISNLLA